MTYTAGKKTRPTPWRISAILGFAAVVALAGCSSVTAPSDSDVTAPSDSDGEGSGSLYGVDDGTVLTMWTRTQTQIQSEAFVEAYNASHENKVELTVFPNDDFQAKIGAAAGSGSLPDLFASDVVFLPKYTSSGLYLDISERIDALPFADDLAPAHVDAGTWDGSKYAVPHVLDLSVMFYNKEIYEQAGLDPELPPTTLEEFGEHARTISAAEIPGVSGTYFGGNCGGCQAFTWFPSIWAAGGEIMNDDGTAAFLASEEASSMFELYRGLVDDDIVGAGARDETGATWLAPFADGAVGIMPMPSTTLGSMPDTTGVAPIPGIGGGKSTFVGGDALGISATTNNADAAWNFVSWTLGDEAQVEVLAQNNDVVSRTDLTSNKFSDEDERLVTINEVAGVGRTPLSLNFGAAFNDPNGPWVVLMRNQTFGDASTLESDNDAITAVLTD